VNKGKLSLTEMIELKKADQMPDREFLRPTFRRVSRFRCATDSSDDRVFGQYGDQSSARQIGVADDERVHGAAWVPDTKINSEVFRRRHNDQQGTE